ncbi:ABC transporter permease [Patulibacter defluvii]|uniref:ABC transporter permease n=1 Tax=Patulibacter defluvii TaxID=3095358 RepID=UPI002A74E8E5|nr:ABC transporter permease [Patulibacter sp. DM4]
MSALAGTATLLRIAARRDRIQLPVWVYAVVASVVSTAVSYAGLYDTAAARARFAAGADETGAILVLYGRVYDDSVGGLVAWRMVGLSVLIVGLMAILAVVRHTRAEEERGRAELVGAAVVGRQAPLVAALAITGAAVLAVGLLDAIGLLVLGEAAGGALLFAAAVAVGGWVFAAVAAVAAQLVESARTANGIAIGVLGASFLLRAVGDASGDGGPAWPSWLSPIGWSQQTRPFAADRWWPLLLGLALAAALLVLARALGRRRDLGAGLWPPRPGSARAAPRLRGPLVLDWRQQRGAVAGWMLAAGVLGATLGGVASGLDDLVGSSDALRSAIERIGGQAGLDDAFLAMTVGIAAILAALAGVQAVLRLRGDETAGRVEPLLATAVGRLRWAGAQLVLAAAVVVGLLLLTGLAAGLAFGLHGDLGRQLPRMLGAALAQTPAAAVPVALAVALLGLRPAWSAAAWGAVGAFALLSLLGPALRLPGWILDLSPFHHAPSLPGGTVSVAALIGLAAVAVALTVAGLLGLRRRDLG